MKKRLQKIKKDAEKKRIEMERIKREQKFKTFHTLEECETLLSVNTDSLKCTIMNNDQVARCLKFSGIGYDECKKGKLDKKTNYYFYNNENGKYVKGEKKEDETDFYICKNMSAPKIVFLMLRFYGYIRDNLVEKTDKILKKLNENQEIKQLNIIGRKEQSMHITLFTIITTEYAYKNIIDAYKKVIEKYKNKKIRLIPIRYSTYSYGNPHYIAFVYKEEGNILSSFKQEFEDKTKELPIQVKKYWKALEPEYHISVTNRNENIKTKKDEITTVLDNYDINAKGDDKLLSNIIEFQIDHDFFWCSVKNKV